MVYVQRNPFQIGRSFPIEGYSQAPGVDFTESYWLARHYGLLDAGKGQVLAWEPGDSCAP